MVTIKSLLEAGVHFGHQTNRWNPKMKRYIFGEKNGIYIIDLQITLQCFQKAYDFTRDTVAAGESVLFVGTKRQAMSIVEEEANRSGMFFVTNDGLGVCLPISKRFDEVLHNSKNWKQRKRTEPTNGSKRKKLSR